MLDFGQFIGYPFERLSLFNIAIARICISSPPMKRAYLESVSIGCGNQRMRKSKNLFHEFAIGMQAASSLINLTTLIF